MSLRTVNPSHLAFAPLTDGRYVIIDDDSRALAVLKVILDEAGETWWQAGAKRWRTWQEAKKAIRRKKR